MGAELSIAIDLVQEIDFRLGYSVAQEKSGEKRGEISVAAHFVRSNDEENKKYM